MKYLFAVLILSTCVGCASQPSTYVDWSTPDQRDIKATGQAATEAARSNSSKNADVKVQGTQISQNTHAVSHPNDEYTFIVYRPDGSRDHRAELRLRQQAMNNRFSEGIGTYTKNQTSREWDRRMRRKISAEIDRVMDKIF